MAISGEEVAAEGLRDAVIVVGPRLFSSYDVLYVRQAQMQRAHCPRKPGAMVSKKVPGMPDLVQFNVRVPPQLVDQLEEIAARLNAQQGWNKYTKSDVARDLLIEGVARKRKGTKR